MQCAVNKMAACEKCWNDAYLRSLDSPMKSQVDHYYDCIKESDKNGGCSLDEQLGQWKCLGCNFDIRWCGCAK